MHKAYKAHKVVKVLKDSKVHKVAKDVRVLRGFKVHKELKDKASVLADSLHEHLDELNQYGKIIQGTSNTTATKLPNFGIVTIASSNDITWVIEDPQIGCEVKIMTGSTSTGNHYIQTDNATIKSSFGSTQTQIDFLGGGAGMTLVGLSTSLWGVLTKSSTTAVQISS